MSLFVLCSGVVVFTLMLREVQSIRERHRSRETIRELRAGLETTRSQARRAIEDLYVLQTVLTERHVVDDAELSRGRARLIENPRRIAAERESILARPGVSPTQVVIDETEQNVH